MRGRRTGTGTRSMRPALPLYTESDALERADAASADWLSPSRSRSSLASRSSSCRQDICWARRSSWRDCSPVRQFCSAATSAVMRVRCCPIRQTPWRPTSCLVESTYGDRDHVADDNGEQLAQVIRSTVERGGKLIIPAFAIGRVEELLYLDAASRAGAPHSGAAGLRR